MPKKIRIYIADDHEILIEGIIALLKTNPKFEVVGYSLNGMHLVESVCQKEADILIMDINMPEKDGIEVLKEFSENGYCCKVIILSSYDDIKLIKEVLKLGASGYLSKQCAGESIIEAIKTVLTGQLYFSKNIQNNIYSSLSDKPFDYESYDTPTSILTNREIEILKLISLEYSGKKISEELFISINTVETHRKNLLRKLNVKNTVGLVKYALKNKLINN